MYLCSPSVSFSPLRSHSASRTCRPRRSEILTSRSPRYFRLATMRMCSMASFRSCSSVNSNSPRPGPPVASFERAAPTLLVDSFSRCMMRSCSSSRSRLSSSRSSSLERFSRDSFLATSSTFARFAPEASSRGGGTRFGGRSFSTRSWQKPESLGPCGKLVFWSSFSRSFPDLHSAARPRTMATMGAAAMPKMPCISFSTHLCSAIMALPPAMLAKRREGGRRATKGRREARLP
mmetsp:Transcript_94074/g.248543  ORF Transcript_94074/g.248543 Transcript_94074/m.248543 type:complete len:234 (-) Transcript_94074:2-703(-)